MRNRAYNKAFHNRRKAASLILLFCGTVLLGGCAQIDQMVQEVEEEEYQIEQTTILVRKDGTLTETVIDSLDRDYYDAGELEDMITGSVKAFNDEQGGSAVTVDSFSSEEGKVTLEMTYKDAASYVSYNNVVFYNGSMLNAQMEGFLFYNEFRKVTGEVLPEETITNEEPLSHKEYQVVVSDLSHAVRVPGKIVYVSANALLPDVHTAVPDQNAGMPKEEGLVLPSSAVYIEEKEGEVSATDLEQTYLYVIYEY